MNYKIPSVRDMPEIVPIIVETYEPAGVYGSKAVAEINMNGPLPTIANAIYDAVGIRIQKSPFTPEKVLKALRAKAGKVTK
jgi:CO/xanthine dehydrogenase Mo-binding subunit